MQAASSEHAVSALWGLVQDTNRRLREEQDAAFQQSLREDQERERQRDEKRKLEEDAKRGCSRR